MSVAHHPTEDTARDPRRVRTFFTVIKGAPWRAGPSGLSRHLSMGAGVIPGEAPNGGGSRCERVRDCGGGPGARGAAARPAVSALESARRATAAAWVPRTGPARGTRRYAPRVTAPARAAGPSSSRRASCRRERAPSRSYVLAALRALHLDGALPRQRAAPVTRTGRN